MKSLVIYGCNYLEVVRIVDAINQIKATYKIEGFIDDDKKKRHKLCLKYPILGGKEVIPQLLKKPQIEFFSNVNSSLEDRKKIYSILKKYNCKIASLIYPTVNTDYTKIGRGSVMPVGSTIGTNSKFGKFLTCRMQSNISHDVCGGDFIYLSPGVNVCGYVKIANDVFIGAGATVLPKVKIGRGAIIGAGSLVNKDIPPGVVAYGSPAKIIRKALASDYRAR